MEVSSLCCEEKHGRGLQTASPRPTPEPEGGALTRTWNRTMSSWLLAMKLLSRTPRLNQLPRQRNTLMNIFSSLPVFSTQDVYNTQHGPSEPAPPRGPLGFHHPVNHHFSHVPFPAISIIGNMGAIKEKTKGRSSRTCPTSKTKAPSKPGQTGSCQSEDATRTPASLLRLKRPFRHQQPTKPGN